MNVYIIHTSGQVSALKLTKLSDILGLFKDNSNSFALCDCEQRLLTTGEDEGIYIYYDFSDVNGIKDANEALGHINLTAARMLLDTQLLEPPCIIETDDQKVIMRSLEAFPRCHAVVYRACRSQLMPYTGAAFKEDWARIFQQETPYRLLAKTRFKEYTQPLLECQMCMKPRYRETAKSLVVYYLNEKPTLGPTQHDRLLRALLGSALFMLIGEKQWDQLSKFQPRISTFT